MPVLTASVLAFICSSHSGGEYKQVLDDQEEPVLYNDKPLFRCVHDPDKWLCYTTSGFWMVSDTKNKDANETRGWCWSVESGCDHPTKVSGWNEFVDDEWVAAPSMKCVVETPAEKAARAKRAAATQASQADAAQALALAPPERPAGSPSAAALTFASGGTLGGPVLALRLTPTRGGGFRGDGTLGGPGQSERRPVVVVASTVAPGARGSTVELVVAVLPASGGALGYAPGMFPRGTRVQAMWKDIKEDIEETCEHYYDATVVGVNGDGTYELQYGDGDHDEHVPARDVRIHPADSAGAAAAADGAAPRGEGGGAAQALFGGRLRWAAHGDGDGLEGTLVNLADGTEHAVLWVETHASEAVQAAAAAVPLAAARQAAQTALARAEAACAAADVAALAGRVKAKAAKAQRLAAESGAPQPKAAAAALAAALRVAAGDGAAVKPNPNPSAADLNALADAEGAYTSLLGRVREATSGNDGGRDGSSDGLAAAIAERDGARAAFLAAAAAGAAALAGAHRAQGDALDRAATLERHLQRLTVQSANLGDGTVLAPYEHTSQP
jgi:hypothetical protein